MKQKDIALIIIVVAFSGIISVFVSKDLISSPKSRQQQAEIVQPITSDFPAPDTRYFNNSSFDPAQSITIGQNQNNSPFSTNSTSP